MAMETTQSVATLWLCNIAMENGPCIDDFRQPDVDHTILHTTFKEFMGKSEDFMVELGGKLIDPCSRTLCWRCGFVMLPASG